MLSTYFWHQLASHPKTAKFPPCCLKKLWSENKLFVSVWRYLTGSALSEVMNYLTLILFPAVVVCEYGEIIPELQLAFVGTNPTIFCNSSTQPTWFKNGIEIEKNHKNPLYVSFYDVLEEDSGYYACHGKFADNRRNFTIHSKLLVGGKC